MTRTERILSMPEKAKLLARMQAPLRRLAEVGDVAGAVSFLLGPDARHITGVTLPVCGGVLMG
jgi:NAD(P)-dependent dehydrogenase (short-subunit alcohol dehydrogenase family)